MAYYQCTGGGSGGAIEPYLTMIRNDLIELGVLTDTTATLPACAAALDDVVDLAALLEDI